MPGDRSSTNAANLRRGAESTGHHTQRVAIRHHRFLQPLPPIPAIVGWNQFVQVVAIEGPLQQVGKAGGQHRAVLIEAGGCPFRQLHSGK